MDAPFAALEARVNAACLAKLANAEATLPDLSVVPGLFENAAVPVFGVVPGFTRQFQGDSVALADLEVGDAITVRKWISGVPVYEASHVIAAIEPDGTGMTVLGLK